MSLDCGSFRGLLVAVNADCLLLRKEGIDFLLLFCEGACHCKSTLSFPHAGQEKRKAIPNKYPYPSCLCWYDCFTYSWAGRGKDENLKPDSMLAVNCISMTSERKSTRLNSSHLGISYAVFCLKKKIK